MKILSAVVLASTLVLSAAASAQTKLDLNKVSCKELFENNKEVVGWVLGWLDAFYRDEDSPAIIDFEKIEQDGKKLGEYCAKNPNQGLIQAADEVYGK